MGLFWRKQKNVEAMLDSYQEHLDQAVDCFRGAMERYLAEGPDDGFAEQVSDLSKRESHLDDLRREIEMTLYGRQLLPESRGDLLNILEAVDKIPNVLETTLYILLDEDIEWPEEFSLDLRELMVVNLEAYHLVRKAFDSLLNNPSQTLYACKEVDAKESESDTLERALIRRIYRSDRRLSKRNQLKQVVLMLGSVSDRGENCADRISIVAIKRNI